jgi:hypothetical protein
VNDLKKLRRVIMTKHHPDTKGLHDQKAKDLAQTVSVEISAMYDKRLKELGATWLEWCNSNADAAFDAARAWF